MEVQALMNMKQAKKRKRKQYPQHSAEIVFTKGDSIQTVPSLSTLLKGVTECIIGLQYVWEYRSPSKSVPPHYQCKMCAVYRLQHDMVAHVRGWKHSFRYMKMAHPRRVNWDEGEAVKDPSVRKSIKEAAGEVQQMEGRGQIKVILKEPWEVPGFEGLRSAIPKVMPPPALRMGLKAAPFGPRFSGPGYPGDFPPEGGPLPDYPVEEYEESGFGEYSTWQDFPDSEIEMRPFSDGMGHHPDRSGDGLGPGGGRDGYGRSGQLEESSGRMYLSSNSDEYRVGPMGSSSMDRPMDKPMERPGLMGAAPESRNPPNALLSYLDTFRIENESDAQLVLKVTQKLTDVLMEYRLRSISSGSNLNSLSMSSSSFSSTPSRLSSSSDRFSSSLSGPPRYSDIQSRYYK
ncbi:uncharacterized protein si:ch211-197h24.6 isoform X1 [Platichthys flesus]|uniref:uncharacterized protein si:ch211-197h24.6 isoform X1 n=2 Tax=Platichthys flesus TaxID=8260 RepID=UPI002DB91DB8|nr:uncharacterized protein si:ch211-197h24.6 isoform X1 [Platichthys flesus]